MIEQYLKVTRATLILCARQTLYMVALSLIGGALLGMLLSIILILTRPKGLMEKKYLYLFLNTIVNMVRSTPFIILLVAIMPFTKFIVGTRIGTTAALIPLIVNVAPYLSRLFENSMLGVDEGIIEAAQSMGASKKQIIWYFLIPEAKSSLILALTTGTISLLGSTAMAGAIGAGGIGNLAIIYGHERVNTPLMVITVLILIIIVHIFQSFGNALARRFRH
ncbi:MAG: ABC transporter permease [Fusobacteriaceae bacterium]|nr:ABC transporter permease [Fusobacteriaceae bacterium]